MASATGDADPFSAAFDQGNIAALWADIKASFVAAIALMGAAGGGEEEDIVRRLTATKAYRDKMRSGQGFELVGVATPQSIGRQGVRIGIGKIVAFQIADAKLAEHIVED